VAEIEGPEAGLAMLEGLGLDDYRYFHSARAELLRRAGSEIEARAAYQRAVTLAQTEAERRSLQDRLTQLGPFD
jgi:RNA polymerase sigma-70 factor (ECF subfamily)